MGTKEILEFVKIEHTLFSLPFVLIGYILAYNQFFYDPSSSDLEWIRMDLLWILVAAVGARGFAMALNRIIDRDIDAANPRTSGRHLVSGSMSMNTAWKLSAIFLGMLLIGAWQLNEVALMMAWLPVLAFVIYPYTKRYTWLCHLWLGLCLGLAPAGALNRGTGHVITGTTKPGVNGLFDMGGNVWEWTATERNGGYITRGSSWWYGPERQQESDVESKPGDIAVVYIGFRCVADAVEQ